MYFQKADITRCKGDERVEQFKNLETSEASLILFVIVVNHTSCHFQISGSCFNTAVRIGTPKQMQKWCDSMA